MGATAASGMAEIDLPDTRMRLHLGGRALEDKAAMREHLDALATQAMQEQAAVLNEFNGPCC